MEAICKKPNQKVMAKSCIARYLQKHKAYILYSLYKTFIELTFNYYAQIWFCGTTANYTIKPLHKSALRVLHGYYTSTFEELQVKLEEIIIHCSNLQQLLIEICECFNYTSPSVSSELFTTKEINYDL